MTPDPWQDVDRLLRVIQTLVLPVVGYGVVVLRGIWSELAKMNARVGKVEIWTQEHEKSDLREFGAIRRELDHLGRSRDLEGP